MKKSWWKVPLYCVIASWVCWEMKMRFLLMRFARVELPDGAITVNMTNYLILEGALFLAVAVLGGVLLFRKMTRRELLCSASVLAALHVAIGLLGHVAVWTAARACEMEFFGWSQFVSTLLHSVGLSELAGEIISWILPPYIFVLFGKRGLKGAPKEDADVAENIP